MPRYPPIPEQPALYTVDDDEPDTIEVDNPRDFGGKTHVTRDDLTEFYISEGCSRKQAIKKADLEFEARAPNYGLWGANVAGPSDYNIAGGRHHSEASRIKAQVWEAANNIVNDEKSYSRGYSPSDSDREYSKPYYPEDHKRSDVHKSRSHPQDYEKKTYGTRYYPDEFPSSHSASDKYREARPRKSHSTSEEPRVHHVDREPSWAKESTSYPRAERARAERDHHRSSRARSPSPPRRTRTHRREEEYEPSRSRSERDTFDDFYQRHAEGKPKHVYETREGIKITVIPDEEPRRRRSEAKYGSPLPKRSSRYEDTPLPKRSSSSRYEDYEPEPESYRGSYHERPSFDIPLRPATREHRPRYDGY
ncbi:hypothetical protein GLAREA_09063 [Glarea lozoyensis ATCC 20868]|uniref:Uncharacterized protein n=1 Tax=Glarea lozoyensis (strain ATCC 20868 / MF5171) TaxID=1116229 RepID=S3DGT0_GLAL2|nr:uncharacterized protein GLAREA_09063 [Glarea lozoyensis ATCC 20868]EPE36900.1 hypothetical protein GLAREA_09063 [Glarea lozoyensis ATCC 20868]